jgi:hypothetical protein
VIPRGKDLAVGDGDRFRERIVAIEGVDLTVG